MLIPQRPPTLPGAILKEHFLEPRGVTIVAFARAVGCSRKHISRIIHGNARIEAALASKIAAVLDTTPEFWLNLQNAVDLHQAGQQLQGWQPGTLYRAAG